MITGNYLSTQYAIIYNLYSVYNEAYLQCSVIFNNCSPWRQIVVDIYRAAKWRRKYPPVTLTLR